MENYHICIIAFGAKAAPVHPRSLVSMRHCAIDVQERALGRSIGRHVFGNLRSRAMMLDGSVLCHFEFVGRRRKNDVLRIDVTSAQAVSPVK